MSRSVIATYRTPLLPLLGLVAILLTLAGLLLSPQAASSQSAPTVIGVVVSSNAGDDTYLLGETVSITLTFSETVNVTGAPRLKIDMDPADWGEKWASYNSGSGTASLTFAHTVVEPNLSTQGIAVLENTLGLNGGTIRSAASQTDADLSHTGLDHNARHKVDWRRSPPAPTPTPTPAPTPTPTPSVTEVAVSSDAGDDNTYLLGETIRITLTFSETVDVSGAPRLKIDMDPAEWGEKQAGYDNGSGTASLTFAHTVVEPNLSTQGIAVLADTLELNGGSIQSVAAQIDADLSHTGLDHNASHKVDWRQSPPATISTVTDVAVSSDAGDDDTYLLGETIRITLTFSETVNVTGAPQLKIDMDPAEWGEKWTGYHSGSGTASLTFTHTVVEPNISTQGIAVLADTLELNGGSIQSVSSQTDADLSHTGLAHDASHKVDWRRSPGQPNQAPVVDTQAENYEWFTSQQNIPRGLLFSKSFYQVFTDPDGDELTYSVSASEDHRQLLDDLSIGLDYRTPENSHQPMELFHRVWFEVDGEDDWKGISPALSDPVVVTATLTATDPEGLSVSLDSGILIDWESHPEVVSTTASEQAIALTFDVAVEADPAPTAGQFTVNVVNGDGTTGTVSVSGVTVNGAVVTLGLASELAEGQAATLDYAHHDDTPLKRDSDGGDPAPGFQGQAVDTSQLGLPGAVANFSMLAEPGELDVLARWDAVKGATSYKLRWRESGGTFAAADVASVSGAAIGIITVSSYGRWEVRVQGCNNDGCGLEASGTVDVVPAASLRLERAVDAEGQARPRTLTATWDPVEDATSYLLRWWPANENPPAPAQPASNARQTRSIGGRGASTQTQNQLTVPGDQTGADIAVPDERVYRVDLQARGDGNQIIAQGDAGVGQMSGQPDTTPPTIVRGEINGNRMTVYFSEALDEDHAWGKFTAMLIYPGSFTYADFSSNMVVSGNAVTVDFEDHLWAVAGLTVATYYLPDSTTGRSLRDLAGNRVSTPLPWYSLGICSTPLIYLANVTPPPMLDSVEAYPYWVALAVDHRLDERLVPAASAFTVTVNGSAVRLVDFQPVNVAGNTVRLVLDAPVLATDVLTVSYAKPSSGSKLRGVANEVAGFAGRAVTNRVGAAPAVKGVAITSTPAADQTYAHGETIQVSLTFTEAVTVVGTPRLRIRMPMHYGQKWIDYAGGSGSTTLTFSYTVKDLDRSTQGIAVLADTLELNDGSIQSVATPRKNALRWYGGLGHNADHKVDWRRSTPGVPWVTGVAITSDPGDDFVYSPGETIQVTLTYDQAVNVTGAPRLKIKMDPAYGENQATYASGGGTTDLVFAYPVVNPNFSIYGVAVLRSTLELNGGAIRSTTATPVDAHLRHEGLYHHPDHRVDAVAPALVGVTVNGNKVSVAYGEELDGDSVPPASAFTVKRTPQGNSEETVSLDGAPTIAGGAVLLTLANAVVATDTGVKVSYAKPTTAADSKLRDQAGNEAASFTDQAADATDTTPPRLVGGQINDDVMVLYFSEALDPNSPGNGDRFRVDFHVIDPRAHNYGHCGGVNYHALTVRPREVIVKGNTVTLEELGYGHKDFNMQRVRVGRHNNRSRYLQSTDPNASILRDLAGNAVDTPNSASSKYRSTDFIHLRNITRQPRPKSATVDGDRLTLTFRAPMEEHSVPAASAFTVKVNGSAVSLASASPVSLSDWTVRFGTVTLNLAAAVASGDTVTVSYERPERHWLRNVACEFAPSFTDQAVTNSTP